jgi:hypothetical protein
MAKIRGFKPGLWTDDDFVELSPWARLLWMGMWTFACDNGHLPDKSKQIKMQVLPADEVNCAELLRELADRGRITREDGWITIPNLTYHQKPDRRYFATCSKEGCEEPPQTDSQRKSRRVHAVHSPGARRLHATEGDGEGEVMVKVMVNNPLSDKSDQSASPNRFDEFWNTYDHKVSRKKAETAYRAALKKPGVTDDLLISAAAQYVGWVKRDGKHPQFTKHPTTWLNGECWRDERTERTAPLTRTQQHLQLARDLAEQEQGHLEIGEGR